MADEFIHKTDVQDGRRKYEEDINSNNEVKVPTETLVEEEFVLFFVSRIRLFFP